MSIKSRKIQGHAILTSHEYPREFLKTTFVWLSLFHYYTIFSGFLAYLFVFRKKVQISNADFLLLCGLILLFIFQLFIKDPFSILKDFRFYWGWVIFYFIFKANVIDQKIFNTVLVILSVVTLAEAVLINTVISAQVLPNFPTLEAGLTEFVGNEDYQRPYSFGASATVSSSLLVLLMAICNVQGWRFALSVLAVLVFISGTGTLALLLLLLLKYRPLIIKSFLPLILLLLLSSFFFNESMLFIFERFMGKIGPDYLADLADIKTTQLFDSYQNLGIYEYFFGDPNGFRGGDFGVLAFVLANGFFGLLLFLAAILSCVNKVNAFPLFLIVGTSFHYPVLFFLPGQMMFGWLLSIKKDVLLDKTECVLSNSRSQPE